ncbi:hypothetical protein DSO57_1001469 [Entomophthora muscae]|uniref:Uncharacterized protein n=1 Tax=Entomophthora muscae TaxID=34485 RepID=A0ACC2UI18_9FUNG|nr:hypothetical protein DSO57_1001469 [Entomophthora muscae]
MGRQEEEASQACKERNSSSVGAYFNVVCIIAGTGTLNLPEAIGKSGWVGIVLILVSAVFALYSGNLLIECLYATEDRMETFPDVGEAAFGRAGRIVVQVFSYALMLGVAAVFIMLIALGGQNLGPRLFGVALADQHWVMISGLLVMIPYVLFRNMREVGFLSIFGALATLVVILVVIFIGFLKPPSYTPVHKGVILEGLAPALATISFSFGGNVVYPHVEASMRNPHMWRRMLFMAISTIAAMYLVIGVVGYWVYGSAVKAPITNSLHEGIPAQMATLFITLHVIAAAPILLCSFSLEMEAAFNIHRLSPIKEHLARYISRILLVAILTVIVMYVKSFGALMTLVGALANCMIVYVLPIACHLKLKGVKSKPFYELGFILLILVVAAYAGFLGTRDAIMELTR